MNNEVCDAFQQFKSHQLPFSLSTRVTTSRLDMIYCGVWGPAVNGHHSILDLLMIIVVSLDFVYSSTNMMYIMCLFSFKNQAQTSG
jgi:hypothetical protein